jgi:hypothetical protein
LTKETFVAFLILVLSYRLISCIQIRTLLPVSNAAFETSTKERALFLSDALITQTNEDLSSFAAQVVLVSLGGSKLAELQRYDPTAGPLESAGSIWLKPQRLGVALTTEFRVPEHLAIPFVPLEPTTAFLNMSAHAFTISVHRTARAQLAQEFVSADMLSQSRKLCIEAASKIVMIMKVTSHWDILSVSNNAHTIHFEDSLTHRSSIPGQVILFTWAV